MKTIIDDLVPTDAPSGPIEQVMLCFQFALKGLRLPKVSCKSHQACCLETVPVVL